MNDLVCIANRVIIKLHDYSKENRLAIFVPQTKLTPKKIFWSLDLEKRKAEELQDKTPPFRKIVAATMYPPNTPIHLVPLTLLTECKTLISIYILCQLFAHTN